MNVQFTPDAWRECRYWIDTDPKMLAKIVALIEDVRRSPFSGLGKPEPLRGNRAGWWSRRIDGEHRLVYRIVGAPPEQRVEIAQCRFHY